MSALHILLGRQAAKIRLGKSLFAALVKMVRPSSEARIKTL
jgi:hypothetical protein